MKGYRVYNSIQQLKDMGFKRAAVAAQLQINRRTVDRYWTMTADEYETQQQALKRGSSVDDYRDQILYWLRAYPTLSSAQVCDWLKEHYNEDFSASRYKYAEMQSRPFTAADLVNICHNCFRYFGGMPREMVLDQDSIVCVSENAGDIVYTYEFEKFRQETKMTIYMCRGADPESKGKIENTVKYIKGNFLSNRLYVDDGILNGSCLEWLSRTANAKVHGTTKRIPAEVFKEECEHLRPLVGFDEAVLPVVCRTVRKDNTIIYDSNRYSVPLGTYNKQPEVRIETKEGTQSQAILKRNIYLSIFWHILSGSSCNCNLSFELL